MSNERNQKRMRGNNEEEKAPEVTLIETGFRSWKNCVDLTSIELSKNIIKIGAGAFWGCTGLTHR